MFENDNRVGRFTSSQMSKLMSNSRKEGEPGAPFQTYVDQKRRERKLGRSMDLGKGNRSTAWGQLMEAWVLFDKLGFTYAHHGKNTSVHPVHSYWAGTADLLQVAVKVGDIKSYEPDNFTKLADVLQKQSVSLFKSEYPIEYWQLVSNACIHSVTRAESILFMPHKKDLEKIRDWMNGPNAPEGPELHRCRFILDSDDEELPYIPDNCEAYKSLETFEFEVPQEDIDALTARVILAEYRLMNPQKTV